MEYMEELMDRQIEGAISENEQLRTELERCAAALPGSYYMDPPDGDSVTVGEQVERMAQDFAAWRESRAMLVARLENMQDNGDCWLTVQAVLALMNDCDMLASRAKEVE